MTTTNPNPDTDHTDGDGGIPCTSEPAGLSTVLAALAAHDDLLAAARAALERLRGEASHARTCKYRRMVTYGMLTIAEIDAIQAKHCTCGLWQTREALRAAIEKATGAAGGGEAT